MNMPVMQRRLDNDEQAAGLTALQTVERFPIAETINLSMARWRGLIGIMVLLKAYAGVSPLERGSGIHSTPDGRRGRYPTYRSVYNLGSR